MMRLRWRRWLAASGFGRPASRPPEMPKGRPLPCGGKRPFWRVEVVYRVTLSADPCHRSSQGRALAGGRCSLRERPRVRTCALHPEQICRLAPLRAAEPCGTGGFRTGLPCGASQSVQPCLGAVARLWPRWRWPRVRCRDPESLCLGRFQAGKPFPACGVVLDHPASNDAKCIDRGEVIQASYGT